MKKKWYHNTEENIPEIKVGTILQHSIGCGHDNFWQVVSRTNKTVKARKLKDKHINIKVKYQTCDKAPIKDKFEPPVIQDKYMGGYKEGKSRFKKVDINEVKLRLSDDGRIGPQVRMVWWSIWDGKPQGQWSN